MPIEQPEFTQQSPPLLRAVIVAAVSTGAQATDDKASIPVQLEDCRAACAAHQWVVAHEIVIPGHSRDYDWLHEIIRDCPEYAALVGLVERDEVALVVCRHYDRLWRTDALRAQLAALCRQHRVQIYSVAQPQEPIDPALVKHRGGLRAIMETLSGALSEEEQSVRRARHQAGMAGRIRSGRHHAGPVPPYGYRAAPPDYALEIDPSEAPWVREIFERRVQGVGVSRIAADLSRQNVPTPGSRRATMRSGETWYPRTVTRILENPVYKGVAHWGRYRNDEATHPSIVDEETFERAQEVARERTAIHRYHKTYQGDWLNGLLRCGFCGRSMFYYKVRGKPKSPYRLYLRCSRYLATMGQECQNNGHSARRVHAYVLERIRWALGNPDAYLAMRSAQVDVATLEGEVAEIDRALADCRARHARWSHAYEVGAISLQEFIERRNRADDEAAALDHQQAILARRLRETAPPDLGDFAPALAYLDQAPPDTLRAIARELVRKVVLERGQEPAITWR